jgi:hypothetical protein
VFKKFEILRLHTSYRQKDDPEFSNFLDRIGDDHENDAVDLGRLRHTQSIRECIQFVFPPTITPYPQICVRRAILSPVNEYVEQFNSKILRTMPGAEVIYFSSDWIEEDGQEISDHPVGTQELLNSLTEPGIPPHELKLKIGTICRLTRNFDASRGLTKNTRVIIRALHRFSVEVETIAGIIAGQTVEAVCHSTTRNTLALLIIIFRQFITFLASTRRFNLAHLTLLFIANNFHSLYLMPQLLMAALA